MSSFFQSVNPYTGEKNNAFPLHSDTQLEQVISLAEEAYKSWNKTPIEKRKDCLLTLAELIKSNKDVLAEKAVLEMGKPISEAKAEVLKCVTACEFYAANAGQILTSEFFKEGERVVEVRKESMGIILGIFPWNFPYWQIVRSLIPIVVSGNAMLVKPAPCVPECSLLLQELINKSGFPEFLIQTIFADENQISKIIADDRIKGCTLTGSEKAGSVVASQAGRVIKPVVLELGGSDPFIVMEDADIELALNTAIIARFQNNGQSCIASKRFILHSNIADEFISKLKHLVAALKPGNPMNDGVNIGPLARLDLLQKLKKQVDESVMAGARIVYQHPFESAHGYFFPPTILTSIPENAPAFKEELFGPVLSVFTFQTLAEAIKLANATSFGLGASIWTSNKNIADEMVSEIECGTVYVNGLVKSNAKYPFGGAKHSGVGRELGVNGLLAFVNYKTIWH